MRILKEAGQWLAGDPASRPGRSYSRAAASFRTHVAAPCHGAGRWTAYARSVGKVTPRRSSKRTGLPEPSDPTLPVPLRLST